MSGDAAYADIIILALVAGFILLRLRSILGKHTDVPTSPTPQAPNSTSEPAQEILPPEEEVEEDEASFVVEGDSKKLASQLKAIKMRDPAFRVSQFLEGAKSAFEMVLEAFANDDKKTLKLLLSSEVYQDFNEALKARKQSKEREETTLISMQSSDITEVELEGSTVRITVQFTSEQVNLVRDEQNEIVSGDPSHIEVVQDEWTFERDLRSSDPNWKLVATEA
jgi:predicted lipid-binding transport protein (Tim44 family)